MCCFTYCIFYFDFRIFTLYIFKNRFGFVSKFLSYLIITILFLLEKIVQTASVMPSFLTGLVVPSYSMVIYFCYYLIIAMLLFKIRIRKVHMSGIALFIVSILFIQCRPCSNVIFYDVGQGNCIYVESKYGTKGLIDAGEGFTKVSELLLKRGVTYLDFIVVSHGHSDHIGGMYDIIDTLKVKYLFVPDNCYDEEVVAFSDYARRRGVNVIKVSNSSYYKPDKAISAEILFYFDKDSLNNSSLMVKLEIEQMRMLIASDIEEEAERYFVHAGRVFDCDVLQVPHHGSDTSSTLMFLNESKPEVAVICVGRKNKFGHPNKVVLDRLDKCDVYRTDNDGAITIKIEGRNFLVKKVITDDISGF